MIVIGLTGSIAMGKSTVARMFEDLGVPVFDSDAEVHRQYAVGGEAVAPIAALYPDAVIDGAVDRAILSGKVLGNARALKQLEEIVHPIVRRRQERFLEDCRRLNHNMAVLDIPLLFETNRQAEVDVVVVVSAPAEIQRERALARPGMTEERLTKILARQIDDAEKRRRANFVVDTSGSFDQTRAQVATILERLGHGKLGGE